MKKVFLVALVLFMFAVSAAAQSVPQLTLEESHSHNPLRFLKAVFPFFQASNKTVTLAWDPMPVGEKWAEVRIYEITTGTDVLVATATCVPGPPITCPTQVSFQIARAAHTWVGRSSDSFWESDNSNTVSVNGPPKPPGNVTRK